MNINLTLIGQLLSFMVFVWFTMKFVWPPIMAALEERKREIANGLAAGEQGRHEQKLAREHAKEVLHDARGEAGTIIAQAQKRATEILDEAKVDARTEGEQILNAAQVEIEQERNRAREQLRGRVAKLAISGAEKILNKEINAEAHKEIVEALARQI